MALARNYPMCENSKIETRRRMIFFSSISKLNPLARWATKTVLDE
jgi:hypothetical protein